MFREKTIVNGETCIKPYYYLRNGYLHVRYTVDRCMLLSQNEEERLKDDISVNPADKQSVLHKAWSFLANAVGKEIIHDGIAELEKTIKRSKGNGYKN